MNKTYVLFFPYIFPFTFYLRVLISRISTKFTSTMNKLMIALMLLAFLATVSSLGKQPRVKAMARAMNKIQDRARVDAGNIFQH